MQAVEDVVQALLHWHPMDINAASSSRLELTILFYHINISCLVNCGVSM